MSLEEVTNNEGEQMQIQIQKENIAQIKTGGVSSEVSLKIVQEKEGEKTRLNAQLSNGKNIEIKIMPDTASEKAIGKLKIKNCNEENNCQIELKETGKGEEIKAVYEIRAQKQSKLFGFIKTKMRVMAQVNAENGEIERAEKSWWAFLASEPEETT